MIELKNDFAGYCNAQYEEAKASCADAEDFNECYNPKKAEIDAKTVKDSDAPDKNLNVQNEINQGYFKDGNPEKGLSDNYFPSADWGQSLWVDTSAID